MLTQSSWSFTCTSMCRHVLPTTEGSSEGGSSARAPRDVLCPFVSMECMRKAALPPASVFLALARWLRVWQEAMGANVVNTVAEGVAPMLARIANGRTGLRILSNLAVLRTATASFRLNFDQLAYRGARRRFAPQLTPSACSARTFVETHTHGSLHESRRVQVFVAKM